MGGVHGAPQNVATQAHWHNITIIICGSQGASANLDWALLPAVASEVTLLLAADLGSAGLSASPCAKSGDQAEGSHLRIGKVEA